MTKVVISDDNGELLVPKEFIGVPRLPFKIDKEGDMVTIVRAPDEREPTDEEVEEWIKSFDEWQERIQPKAPHLPDEALRRETFYD